MIALGDAGDLMSRLCEIPSPSRDEAAVADVVRDALAGLGADITEDDAAAVVGCGSGNIVARFAATAPGMPVMFCAHLDTVPQVGPIEVMERDGMLTNRHATILGGDNKSAVAALLTSMERVTRERIPHAGIEIVFTPCEEIGLLGAAHFDPGRLNAAMGFVYDHTGEIGGIVGSAPSLHKLDATFVGRAAHAGIAPESGRSAIQAAAAAIARMPLGRIDASTTANIGLISGGQATNVVADRCTLNAEARSRDELALSAQVDAMVDAMTAAATSGEVDLEISIRAEFRGYRLRDREPQVALAIRALEAVGARPRLVASGGGSDVNALLKNGFPAVNLCNGMVAPHTADERIARVDLLRMVDVTLAILAEARSAA